MPNQVVVYKHPLYLREHSKRILRSALFNDSASGLLSAALR